MDGGVPSPWALQQSISSRYELATSVRLRETRVSSGPCPARPRYDGGYSGEDEFVSEEVARAFIGRVLNGAEDIDPDVTL